MGLAGSPRVSYLFLALVCLLRDIITVRSLSVIGVWSVGNWSESILCGTGFWRSDASLVHGQPVTNLQVCSARLPSDDFQWLLHSAALIRRPLLTQCATAAVLFGTGDVIAQRLVEGRGYRHDVSNITFRIAPIFLISLYSWCEQRAWLSMEVRYNQLHTRMLIKRIYRSFFWTANDMVVRSTQSYQVY